MPEMEPLQLKKSDFYAKKMIHPVLTKAAWHNSHHVLSLTAFYPTLSASIAPTDRMQSKLDGKYTLIITGSQKHYKKPWLNTLPYRFILPL